MHDIVVLHNVIASEERPTPVGSIQRKTGTMLNLLKGRSEHLVILRLGPVLQVLRRTSQQDLTYCLPLAVAVPLQVLLPPPTEPYPSPRALNCLPLRMGLPQ